MRLKIVNCKNSNEREPYYKQLLKIARSLQQDLEKIVALINKLNLENASPRHFRLLSKVNDLLPHIIDQAHRRVIKGESIPSDEKIISIFEEHSDIIVKGRRDTEFGHKVFLTADQSGLVTHCQLVQGNPSDSEYFIDLIDKQKEIYGRVPRQTSADGGFASADNVDEAKELGVSDVCFSKRCGLEIEDMAKSRWVFEKLRNFRAGIEGIISVLKRGFGLEKALWKGVSGFASYVHSSIVSYNLTVLARLSG